MPARGAFIYSWPLAWGLILQLNKYEVIVSASCSWEALSGPCPPCTRPQCAAVPLLRRYSGREGVSASLHAWLQPACSRGARSWSPSLLPSTSSRSWAPGSYPARPGMGWKLVARKQEGKKIEGRVSGRWGCMHGVLGRAELWLQPAWAWVLLGSVGCRNQQQLLLRVAGSRHRGVLLSCESPQQREVMLTHVSPQEGSDCSYCLLRASTGRQGPPAAFVPPKRIGDWGSNNPPAARGRGRGSFPSAFLSTSFPGAPRTSYPHPAEQRGLPGASRGRWPIHVRWWRRGLARRQAGRQGQGGRRAALHSPNAHVRKWLHFSERKREVRLPPRGSQQLPPLAPGCRSCRLPRVHELALPALPALPSKVRSGEAALPHQRGAGSVPWGLWPSPLLVLTPCLGGGGDPPAGATLGSEGGAGSALPLVSFAVAAFWAFFKIFLPQLWLQVWVLFFCWRPGSCGVLERVPRRGSRRGWCQQSQSCLQSVLSFPGISRLPLCPAWGRGGLELPSICPGTAMSPQGRAGSWGTPHQHWRPRMGDPNLAGRSMGVWHPAAAMGSRGAPGVSAVQKDRATTVARDSFVGSCGSRQDRHRVPAPAGANPPPATLPGSAKLKIQLLWCVASSPGPGGAPSAWLLPRFGYLLQGCFRTAWRLRAGWGDNRAAPGPNPALSGHLKMPIFLPREPPCRAGG